VGKSLNPAQYSVLELGSKLAMLVGTELEYRALEVLRLTGLRQTLGDKALLRACAHHHADWKRHCGFVATRRKDTRDRWWVTFRVHHHHLGTWNPETNECRDCTGGRIKPGRSCDCVGCERQRSVGNYRRFFPGNT